MTMDMKLYIIIIDLICIEEIQKVQ